MMQSRLRRRTVLVAGGTLVTAVAGCLGSDDPARFAVTVDAPERGTVGEVVTVGWTVENEGDREDTQMVAFTVHEERIHETEVTLSGGERTTGEFDVTPGSEGALPVTVATDDDEASATVVVEQP